MKITPQEVLELLNEHEYLTKAELSEILSCSKDTIRSKIRTLRNDGEAIIHSNNGLSILSKELLKDIEKADELAAFTDWILASFKGMIKIAHPIKPLLPTMKRTLKESLTKEERKELMQSCIKVAALLTYAEAEEEMDE